MPFQQMMYLPILMLLVSCHQTHRKPPVLEGVSPKSLKINDINTKSKKGQTVAVLTGSALSSAMAIPMWLVYGAGEGDKCGIHLKISAIELHTKDIYVVQDNMYCGGGPVCKLIDPKTKKIKPLKHCIEGDELDLTDYVHLRDDFYLITSAAEGYAIVQIIRYDPVKGQVNQLDIPLGLVHNAMVSTQKDGSFLIKTTCPLPEGCTTSSPETLPLKQYLWHPNSPKVFKVQRP